MLFNAPPPSRTKKLIYDSVIEKPVLLLHMVKLYGKTEGPLACQKLLDLMSGYRTRVPVNIDNKISERDAILVTHGDVVYLGSERPLVTLAKFLNSTVAETITGVHLLGFGVGLNESAELDSWDDVARLRENFQLMLDARINSVAPQNEQFQLFLKSGIAYEDWFHIVDPQIDMGGVFHPDSHSLLTPFETADGTCHAWTTYGPEQIDLNYNNPAVLLAAIDDLLGRVAHGATVIRLDRVGTLWKRLGTACNHLPETHEIIQLIRTVLGIMAPHVTLITETKSPHSQSTVYFGNGTNEASMMTNQELPALMLHAFHSGSTRILSQWVSQLKLPSKEVTFFNGTASQNGIDMTPAMRLVKDAEMRLMGERVKALGGRVLHQEKADGTLSSCELKIDYLTALSKPKRKESADTKADRFLASQAIMLALQGLPGIYFHSLFGPGRADDKPIRFADILADLQDAASLRAKVFYPYRHMIAVRSSEPAFDPYGEQEVLNLHPSIFSLFRGVGLDGVLCLQNVTGEPVKLKLQAAEIYGEGAKSFRNILNNDVYDEVLVVKSFGVLWLKPHEIKRPNYPHIY